MKKTLIILCSVFALSCNYTPSADQIDQAKQERLQKEASAEVGMPNLHNYQEKKMVKMLYELRDNPNLVNYAYLFSEVSGKLIYVGECVGYGLPYSTQFSNPEKWVYNSGVSHSQPQAEPNGLFMPTSAEGTWLMMVDPQSKIPKVVYFEPKIVVSPFKINL